MSGSLNSSDKTLDLLRKSSACASGVSTIMAALDIFQGKPTQTLGSSSDNQNPPWQYVKSVSTTNNVSYKELDDGYYKLTFLYNKGAQNALEFDEDVDIRYIISGGGGGGGEQGDAIDKDGEFTSAGGGGSGGMTLTNLDESSGINSEVKLGITVGNGGPGKSDGGDSTLILQNALVSLVAKGGKPGGLDSMGNGVGGASVYPDGDDGEKSTIGKGANGSKPGDILDASNGEQPVNTTNITDDDANSYYGWGGPSGNYAGQAANSQSKYGSYTNDGKKSYTNPINANPPRLYGGGGGKGGNITSSGGIGQIGSGVQGVIIIYYKKNDPEQDP